MRKRSSNRTSGLWPTPDANAINSQENPDSWLSRRERLKAKGINGNGAGMPLGIAAQLYTETSSLSTEPSTEAQPYLPEGFLVSHFPKPGSAEARKMTVTSGRKCSGLYHKPGPLGSLVRTLLESSTWNSTECFLTWKVKATPSNRLLFQLAPSMPNTDETEFGLWATPNTPNGGRVMKAEDVRKKGSTERGKRQVDLGSQVKMWPTPMSSPGTEACHNQISGQWRTAMAKALYMTPDYGAAKGRGMKSAEANSRLGGSLNPTFVEWLMGYPKNWTKLEDK